MTGRTSFSIRYIENRFESPISHRNVIGLDFRLKDIIYKGIRIKLQLWDPQVTDHLPHFPRFCLFLKKLGCGVLLQKNKFLLAKK